MSLTAKLPLSNCYMYSLVGTTVLIGKPFSDREIVPCLEPSKTIKLIFALNAAKPPLLIVTIVILVKKQQN